MCTDTPTDTAYRSKGIFRVILGTWNLVMNLLNQTFDRERITLVIALYFMG